ncbi:MAG: hypothetical protein R3Y11_00015 [Pseudomonadota bacterium]
MKENAQFIEQHPMFRRLSGQVIWALLEENDASQEECGLFMDTFYERFQAMVRVLARTKSHPSGYIRITAGKAHDILPTALPTGAEGCKGCVGCSSLAGTIYPASMPKLIEHLPPYSIGCSLGMEFLKALPELSEAKAANKADVIVQDALPEVSYQLCCPRRPLSRIILAMRENEPLF